MIRWLDQNENGTLDDEELQKFPPLHEFLEARGVDLKRGMSADDFAELLGKFREKVQRRAELSESSGGTEVQLTSFSNDEDDSGSDDSGKDKPPEKKVATPVIPVRPKGSMSLKLPELYRSKDKDGDGQIGMYEWPRRDLAAFRKLDRNGDGFLTPAELNAGPAKSSTGSSTSVATTSGSTSGTSTTASSSTGTSTGTSTASSSAPAAGSSPAELAFNYIDKDQSKSISAEEWGRSYSARPRFEKAGIKPTLPMSKEEFVQQYQKLP